MNAALAVVRAEVSDGVTIRLPELSPNISADMADLLRQGVIYRCLKRVIALVACLSVESLFLGEAKHVHSSFIDPTSDFLTRLNIWEAYVAAGKKKEWAMSRSLSPKALAGIDDVRQGLESAFSGYELTPGTPENLRRAIGAAYIRNLLLRSGVRTMRHMARECQFSAHSVVSVRSLAPECAVFGVMESEEKACTVSLIHVIERAWIAELAPKEDQEPVFVLYEQGLVHCRRVWRFQCEVLRGEEVATIPSEQVDAFIEAIVSQLRVGFAFVSSQLPALRWLWDFELSGRDGDARVVAETARQFEHAIARFLEKTLGAESKTIVTVRVAVLLKALQTIGPTDVLSDRARLRFAGKEREFARYAQGANRAQKELALLLVQS